MRRFFMEHAHFRGEGDDLSSAFKAVVIFIGFILLCWLIYDKQLEQESVMAGFTTANSYYIPPYSEKGESEKDILNSMLSNATSYNCPEISLNKALSLVNISYSNNYGVRTWVIPNSYIKDNIDASSVSVQTKFWKKGDYVGNPDALGVLDMIGLSTKETAAKSTTEDIKLLDADCEDYITIVSPFDFKFLNNNTDDGKSIVIGNLNDTVRITFDNTANWFCAGIPVMSMTESDSGDYYESYDDWTSHNQNHRNIFGISTNSKIRSGPAGVVIGYASNLTTMRIEEFNGISWEQISVYNLMGFE